MLEDIAERFGLFLGIFVQRMYNTLEVNVNRLAANVQTASGSTMLSRTA
jgi:hypothetical protein